MNIFVYNLIYFVVVFLFVYFLQFNFFIKPKPKRNKKGKVIKEEKKILEIEYISKKFKISKEKILNPIVCNKICLINSFIISFICIIVSNINLNYIFQLFIGFILLLGFIFGIYELYGRHLGKKYGSEEKNEQ